MIELELPFPPSVNHYYRRVGKRTIISREGRSFRNKVCSILSALALEPFTGPLVIDIEVYPPNEHRRDIDNLQKSLLDALEHGGMYKDDSQITKLVVQKYGTTKGGRVIVRIWKAKNNVN